MTDHIYGPNHYIIDKFIKHIGKLTDDDWIKIRSLYTAKRGSVWPAAQDAAWANRMPSNSNKFAVSFDASKDVISYAKIKTTQTAPCNPAWDPALGAVGGAVAEIQGSDLMKTRKLSFFFLPMFGLKDEKAVLNWYERIIFWLTLVTRDIRLKFNK